VTFTNEADDHAVVREIVYTNLVPAASITTAARDARDGDQLIDLSLGDATIIDTVTHADLVPGTEYVLTGELMVRPTGTHSPADSPPDDTDDEIDADADADAGADARHSVIGAGTTGFDTVASSTVALAEMIPSGIVATTTFVASEPDGDVDVTFSVPADSPLSGHVVVVFQQLSVASSGRAVATHADPDATEQTLRFADPPPPTITTTTTTTTTTSSTPTAPTPAPTSTTEPTPEQAPPTTAPAPTTSTSTTTTIATPAPPRLVRTGSNSTGPATLGAVVLLLLGAGLLAATRRPR
jgi:hypothetical protein